MKKEETVKAVLRKSDYGLSISDIVSKTKLSRSTIRIILAKLDGAGQVSLRKVGMAKIYFLKENRE